MRQFIVHELVLAFQLDLSRNVVGPLDDVCDPALGVPVRILDSLPDPHLPRAIRHHDFIGHSIQGGRLSRQRATHKRLNRRAPLGNFRKDIEDELPIDLFPGRVGHLQIRLVGVDEA